MASEIPSVFLERMQDLLGQEFPAFLSRLGEPAVVGLRANTIKITAEKLRERLAYDLTPLPWSADGFWLQEASLMPDQPSPGKHPFHAAGLYYLQEPSAMAAAAVLNPQPGERVLDLCAAPGGKTTHLASLMSDQGLLVANETHPGRVWELAENLERWGVRHAAILNESPGRLADRLGGFFDKVLVDAPCSGEGMFRKSEAARRDWSSKLVHSCALRQSAILDEAVRLVRPGGLLAYSTCTFNPEENEAVVAGLLERQRLLEMVQVKSFAGFSNGRPEWVSASPAELSLSRTVRLWPHLAPGEGHFIALLRQNGDSEILPSEAINTGQKPRFHRGHNRVKRQAAPQVIRSFEDFCQAALLNHSFETIRSQGDFVQVGSYLYWIPDGLPAFDDLRVIHPGWWLGTVKESQSSNSWRFEPSHALAMGLQASQAGNVLRLDVDEPAVMAYLRGEILESEGQDGWVLVAIEDFPLGWGRRLRGRLKNDYPRGLRWL
jgi:NOL1/NOP2/sun family putative RNA methylase